jgi:hypothetical protein
MYVLFVCVCVCVCVCVYVYVFVYAIGNPPGMMYKREIGMLRRVITIFLPSCRPSPHPLPDHDDPLGGEIVTRAQFPETTVTPQ